MFENPLVWVAIWVAGMAVSMVLGGAIWPGEKLREGASHHEAYAHGGMEGARLSAICIAAMVWPLSLVLGALMFVGWALIKSGEALRRAMVEG